MARKAGMSTGVEVARISVKVDPDSKHFRRQLKNDLEEIERTLKGDIEVNSHLNTAQTRADFKRLMAQLKAEGAKGVRIDTELAVGKAALTRGVTKAAGGALSALKDLKFLMPNFGTGINPAGYVAIAGVISGIVVPALGLLSSALTTIPALVAAIGTPIAAVALGMEGIAKAAERLKQPFEDLKSVMNTTFEKRLGPIFDQLKTVFPMLERSMPKVAHGLSDMLQGVTDSVTGDSMGGIESTINSVAQALSNTQPAVKTFTDELVVLTDKVAAKLPGLATQMSGLADDFKNWVTKITTPNENGVSELDTALSTLKGTLGEIFGLVTDMAAVGFEWMADPRFGQILKEFAADLRQIVNELLPEMKTMFEDVATVISAISTSLEKMRDWAPVKDADGEGSLWRSMLQGIPLVGTYIDWARDDMDQATTSANNLNEAINNVGETAKNQAAGLEQLFTGALNPQGAAPAGEGPMAIVNEFAQATENLKNQPPVQIPPPDTEPAKQEVQAYGNFINTVTEQVKGALSQGLTGETLPAPNFDAFKAAWDSLPGHVTTAVNNMKAAATSALSGLEDSFKSAGSRVVSEVQTWPGQIESALSGLYGVGQTAGSQLGAGLAAGIEASTGTVVAKAAALAQAAENAAKGALEINSPSKVFIRIGEGVGEGMSLGLDKGWQPVLDQAKSLAGQVADAFASGQDPTAVVSGFSTQELDRMEKTLGLEIKKLESQAKALEYQYKMTKNEALKADVDRIRALKEELSLQKEMLDLTNEYSEAASDSVGPLEQSISKLMNTPIDFAKATGQQFLSDLGISGNGFISKAITEGINYVFQIGSVDEALSIKDREESKRALAQFGR
ncbi:tape measure protein [Mycobacterium phage Snape]|nr:tape measure protein [Mycobacterium phage Snape]